MCTAVFFPKKKRNLDPAPGKGDLVLNQKLCRLIADAFIGGAAQLHVFVNLVNITSNLSFCLKNSSFMLNDS